MSLSRMGFLAMAAVAILGWALYLGDRGGGEDGNDSSQPQLGQFWYKTILVTKSGEEIKVDPEIKAMDKDDLVRWSSPSGEDFRIEFENGKSPFSISEMSGDEAAEFWSPLTDAARMDYKYSVIMGSYRLDPVIRVEEEGPADGDSSSAGSP